MDSPDRLSFVAGISTSVLGEEDAKIESEESEILKQVRMLHERLAAIEARLARADTSSGRL